MPEPKPMRLIHAGAARSESLAGVTSQQLAVNRSRRSRRIARLLLQIEIVAEAQQNAAARG